MPHSQYLFHDHTAAFLFPPQPEKEGRVTFTLRAPAGEVSEALLVAGDATYTMDFFERRESYDFYRMRMKIGSDPVSYCFRVSFSDGSFVWYDRRGAYASVHPGNEKMFFTILPGFRTPRWAQGAVFYQIMTDRFYNGDAGSDVLNDEYYYEGRPVKKISDWYAPPSPDGDYRHFYGGDLQGVIEKLPYLRDLGIEAIYFNPLFISASSHKYDTQDYEHIDPHLGRIVADYGELPPKERPDNYEATRYICRTTHPDNLEASDALFQRLVSEAHANGIRVILDGVFNHCGSFHKWMDRERIYERATGKAEGAFADASSPYRDHFSFGRDAWPYNDSYEGWWGYQTLPKLNYEGSEALEDYIIGIGKKWVSAPYHADGWRLDVAADLGHSLEYNTAFWKRFREAVKEANPDAVVYAEHYGESRRYLMGGAWDSVMNYDAFMDPVSYFLTGMEKHSDEYEPSLYGNHEAFWNTVRHVSGENFPTPSLYMAMNQISNHDHSRFLTRTSRKTGRVSVWGPEAAGEDVRMEVFRQAAVIQFTWPGAPTIYYGDEAGLCGFTDPDNRRTYPWGREDTQLIRFHKELIRLRRNCPELKTGSLREVYSEHGVISYGRFTAEIASLIVINIHPYALTRDFDVRLIGMPHTCTVQRVLMSTREGFRTDAVDRHVREGILTLVLPPQSALIVRYDALRPLSVEEFWRHHFMSFAEKTGNVSE